MSTLASGESVPSGSSIDHQPSRAGVSSVGAPSVDASRRPDPTEPVSRHPAPTASTSAAPRPSTAAVKILRSENIFQL